MAISRVEYNGETLIDISDSTVNSENLEEGIVAYSANGERVVGNLNQSAILQAVYPVGSIYMSANGVNPNLLFGFGTWEQVKDTFLMACGNNYINGETGGTKFHNHKYGIQYGAYFAEVLFEKSSEAGVLSYDENGNITVQNADIESGSTDYISNGSTTKSQEDVNAYYYRAVGNTSTSDNLPPYLAVYVWKRTA